MIRRLLYRSVGGLFIFLFAGNVLRAQDPLEGLRLELQELRAGFEQVKSELAASRRESEALRRDLQTMREQMAAGPDVKSRIETLEEHQDLIAAKVDDQYQSKVASASKYRLRISGMALFNAVSTRGAVDHLDVPAVAELPNPSGRGSLGASLRQSQIGLEMFGPDWMGARTSGEVRFDFFGGFPASSDGLTSGLVRLRTAKLALDWKNTSIVAEQDAPLFSPISPTSLVSAAYPAFSSAGNMWTWTPQVYVEHRVITSDNDQWSIRGGVMDALTGDPPSSEYERQPTAGERSRIPAIAGRIGWQHTNGERRTAIGAGTYFARQDWGTNQKVDAWAATADWDVPLVRGFSWSGEAYRGRAIGGLGGGFNSAILFRRDVASVIPLDSLGGWTQIKYQPATRWQFNGVIGQDYAFGNRLQQASGELVRRNAAGMLNFIYQARSNLLFSAEYRHMWTIRSSGPKATADHISLGAAILF